MNIKLKSRQAGIRINRHVGMEINPRMGAQILLSAV